MNQPEDILALCREAAGLRLRSALLAAQTLTVASQLRRAMAQRQEIMRCAAEILASEKAALSRFRQVESEFATGHTGHARARERRLLAGGSVDGGSYPPADPGAKVS